jgi:hypothetical protein
MKRRHHISLSELGYMLQNLCMLCYILRSIAVNFFPYILFFLKYFLQLLLLPNPPFKPIYYTLVIIDLCKVFLSCFNTSG